MALAILKFQDQGDTHCRFEIDLGVNRFYLYRIGSGKSQSSNGLPQLTQTKFTSSLFGPLPNDGLGQTVLEVPNQQFDRQNRFIQLFSFRTADKLGPAISEVVEISPIPNVQTAAAMTFSPETAMNSRSLETVPFQYREVQPMSSALFLGALVQVAKAVAAPVLKTVAQVAAPAIGAIADSFIPGAGKVVTGVVNTLTGNTATPAANNTAPNNNGAATVSSLLPQLQSLLANPQVIQSLGLAPQTSQLLGTVLQQLASAATPAAAPAPATSGAMALGSRTAPQRSHYPLALQSADRSAQQNAVATLDRPTTSTALSTLPTYAGEMAVPAALATTPQLTALLQKVFTPETLKMIQSLPPEQALGTITQGLIDASKSLPSGTGTAVAQSVAQALSKPDRTAGSLVQGLSVGLSAPTSALEFQRVDSVQLKFTETTTLMMNGRSRLLYRYDQAIAFPITVTTPRPISKGIVQVLVKHPQTLEVLIEEKYRLENITTGALATVPKLSPERLRSLSPNQDYLVCVSLIWQATSSKTQKKKRVGTSLSQLITLVGEYSFDRIEGTAEIVPLNDVDRFRDYWHKVWEKEFPDSVRRISLDCKYYLTLEPERTNHARMETVTKLEENTPTRLEGKLKTGLIMSPYRLNELISQISSHPSLGAAELAALMTPEFRQQCSYAARSEVEFKGKRGDTVGLWAYPEMKVQRLLLKQAGQTNANGQVLALTEREVYFPMVAIVHFIGVSV